MSIHTLLREGGPLILGDCAAACRFLFRRQSGPESDSRFMSRKEYVQLAEAEARRASQAPCSSVEVPQWVPFLSRFFCGWEIRFLEGGLLTSQIWRT